MSNSPAAYKDILVLTKMLIRMAMWDLPLPIRIPKMTPVGMRIGNLYGNILGSPTANKNADRELLLLIRMRMEMP